MPTPFDDLPPEMQDALRQQWDRQQNQHQLVSMQLEDARHEVLKFMGRLEAEDLHVLRGIITAVMRDSDRETGGWYLGYTTQFLEKLGYCGICAVKHESAEDMLKAHAPKQGGQLSTDVGPPPINDDQFVTPDDEIVTIDSPRYHELLKEYNLTREGDRLLCIGCGTPYRALRDRMLRAPGVEGCETCKLGTKWGSGIEPQYDPSLDPNNKDN